MGKERSLQGIRKIKVVRMETLEQVKSLLQHGKWPPEHSGGRRSAPIVELLPTYEEGQNYGATPARFV
jgi:hypothetical protein